MTREWLEMNLAHLTTDATTTTTMRGNEAELAQIRRGRLMEAASFLTYFQSQFLPESVRREQSSSTTTTSSTTTAQCDDGGLPPSPAPGILSPSDIEAALEYRELLESLQDLEDDQHVTELRGLQNELYGNMNRRRVEQIKDEIDRVQSQIDQRSQREKLINHLLTRFEVWSTKAIAQSLLVESSVACETNGVSAATTTPTDPCCCNVPLLNLPGSKHFQKILPEGIGGDPSREGILSAFHQQTQSCCCLPLPPNLHTWKEFSRITKMTALLDTNELKLASKSPCRGRGFTGGETRNPSFMQKFRFDGPDIVCLWVRAQRNTQALRHLWTLFEIQKETSNEQCWAVVGTGQMGAGKRLVVDNDGKQNTETSKPSSFRAVLRGNTNFARERLVDMSKSTDQLVEWAVANQALFTYRHIRELIQSSAHLRRNKRRRTSALYHQSKRARLIESNTQGLGDETTLKWACRSYILRWFARRNRRVVMALFHSNLSLMHLDIGCTKEDIRQAVELKKSIAAIRSYLGRETISDVTAYKADRTLARIDRRLNPKEFENRYDGALTFDSQVLTLLDALGESVTKEDIDPKLVEEAKADFKILYNHFFSNGKEIGVTAREIVDGDVAQVKNFSAMILSSPAPWVHGCKVCQKEKHDSIWRSCASCEDVCHAECSPATPVARTVSLDDTIRKFPPLRDLTRLKMPDKTLAPNFRSDSDVTWTRQEITVERTLQKNGEVPMLGLRLSQTEDCQAIFDDLVSDDFLVTDLVNIIRLEKQSSKKNFPMAMEHQGCFVALAKQGYLAEVSGLVVGDVIVAAELEGFFHTDADGRRFQESVVHSFSKLEPRERLETLKEPVSKLKLTIMRPSVNIVERSETWWAAVKILNTTLTSAIVSMGKVEEEIGMWFCPKCLADRPVVPEEDTSTSIFRGASFCRAVIRRLGMESYALPFFDENPEDFNGEVEDNGHSRFVSLRRLDNMLTCIMSKYGTNDSLESPNTMGLKKAFYCPPWASSTPRPQRLDWAPEEMEEKPLELFCRAMWLLSASNSAGAKRDTVGSKRSALMRHFLFLFNAWCVGPQIGSEVLPVRGPSNLAMRARVPWLRQGCSSCLVRPRRDGNEGLCENNKCAEAKAMCWPEEFEDTEVDHVTNSMKSYMTCASLVGTTFLVLPDDPLIEAVSQFVIINHNQRPVEFIVVSYLPPAVFESTPLSRRDEVLDRFEAGDGVFHLFPVVNARQLSYLVETCRTRRPPKNIGMDCDDHSWTMLDVLDVEGVPRFSPKELQKKLAEQKSFRSAIDHAVASRVGNAKSGEPSQLGNETGSSVSGFETTTQSLVHFDSDDSTSFYCHAIDCLLYRTSQLSGDMAALRPEQISNLDEAVDTADMLEAEVVEPRKIGLPIIPGSGLKSPHPFILKPQAVSENRCALIYSDICYKVDDERSRLEKALEMELTEPRQTCHRQDIENLSKAPTLTCVLMAAERDATEKLGTFDGIGWGFEVVEWKMEPGVCRIGRVISKSPAHSSGLRTNDIILSVGGQQTSAFKCRSDLICALLGVFCSRIRVSKSGDEVISDVLCTARNAGLTLGPVFITVHQPRAEDRSRQPRARPKTTGLLPEGYTETFRTGRELPRTATGRVAIPVAHRPCEDDKDTLRRERELPRTATGSVAIPVARRPCEEDQYQFPKRTPKHRAGRARAGAHSQRNGNHIDMPGSIRELTQARGNALPPEWKNLYAVVAGTLDSRRPVSFRDLYSPGPYGTFLTLVEAAVFCECLRHQQPMLGIRLLCPRYDLDIIISQMDVLKAHPELVQNVPIIPGDIHRFLIWLDYNRSTSEEQPEVGDPVFFEGIHHYRMPISCLPLDRMVERWLVRNGQVRNGQQTHAQHRLHGVAGGGNEAIANGVTGHAPPLMGPPGGNGIALPQEQAELNGFSRVSPWPELTDAWTQPHVGYQRSPPGNGYQESRLYANATNAPVQRWHQPSYPQDNVPYLAYAAGHSWEDMPERIRGGGGTSPGESDTDTPNARCLADVPVDQWKDKAVFCKVKHKSEGGEVRDATLVGFVTTSPNGHVPDTVEIAGHYLSSIGYYDKPRTYVGLSPHQIYIVDTESDATLGEVVRKLQSGRSGPRRCLRDNGPAEMQRELTDFEKRMNDLATELVSRFGQMTILGELPDGREVLWIQSDPRALYLRSVGTKEMSSSAYLQRAARFQAEYLRCIKLQQERNGARGSQNLKTCSPEKHCCLWGCSVPLGQTAVSGGDHEVLGFSSRAELEEHNEECHALTSALETAICDNERLVRIQEGDLICELNAALTSSMCALRLELCSEASRKEVLPKTTSSGLAFFCAPVARNLAFHPTPKFSLVIAGVVRGDAEPPLRRLILLWNRIARLFAIEGAGLFRLVPNDVHRIFFQRNYFGVESVPVNVSGAGVYCCQETGGSSSSSVKERSSCFLCSLPSEKVIGWRKEGRSGSATDDGSPTYRGIGCALLGDVSDPDRSGPADINENIRGRLGQAKSFLLTVSSYIPEPLRLEGEPTNSADPLAGNRIWDEDHFDVWCLFVREAMNVRMLAQGFIAMLASIRRSRLPDWYTEGSGWSASALALLAEPTLSSFFLHLYVFDAALTEFKSTAHLEKKSVRRVIPGTLVGRMDKFLKLAEKNGVERYNGAHDSSCHFCNDEDGGSLLSCELCKNVQHHKCCDPPVEKSNELGSWICDVCINDIKMLSSNSHRVL